MAKNDEKENDMQSAQNAFAQHPGATVCYINEQGQWLFSNPDKEFGKVVKTLNKDKNGKIS